MMIDRLSILALKIYHTREEAQRMTATETHRNKNAAAADCAGGTARRLGGVPE